MCVDIFTEFQRNIMMAKFYNQKKLEALSTDLKKLNSKLEESNATKTNFILSFSHELRNPLKSVIGNIDNQNLEIIEVPMNTTKFFEKIWSGAVIKMKNLASRMFIAPNVPKTVKIDPHRIMQIISNLIGNASTFTTKGYVKVGISWIKGDHMSESMFRLTKSDENIDAPSDTFVFQNIASKVIHDQFIKTTNKKKSFKDCWTVTSLHLINLNSLVSMR